MMPMPANRLRARSPRLPSLHRLALPLVCLLASGCASAPTASPAPASVPAAYVAANVDWQPATPFAAMPEGHWWEVFQDPVLDTLESRVAQHNPTLAAQLAAHDQARAAIAQAQAAYAPTLGVAVSAERGRAASASRVTQSISASANVAWEPDLWGRVRWQVRAQRANAAASEALLRNTRLSLQATLASSYLQLRTVDAQIRLAQQTVADNQSLLQLTQNRYRAGVGTVADVAAARTTVLQAQAGLTDLGLTRAQLQNAIAVLVGQAPATFELPEVPTLPPVPAIPADLPSALLQRRPDLVAARQQVEAANAQVGIARSAWFPNLTLSGQAGRSAGRVSELFSAPSLLWSLGPQLLATLFDGGARRAEVRASEAGYRQTVADYRQAVLTALEDVENQLAAQRILAHEAEQQAAVVQAAEDSLRLATNQYKAGTAPYLDVLSAQLTAANARNAELAVRNRRYAATVGLIAALGGGWAGGAGQPSSASGEVAKP